MLIHVCLKICMSSPAVFFLAHGRFEYDDRTKKVRLSAKLLNAMRKNEAGDVSSNLAFQQANARWKSTKFVHMI